jgi:NAD(P)-dependent dehydrogenase (short-subunit alcohol dehydrogenase family)
MSDFRNRVALITGAALGIGRQFALQLAEAGASVAAVDLDAAGLDKLADELQGKPVATAVADVTDRPALLQAVAGLEQKLGPTDLLFANAGIGRETTLPFAAEGVEAQVRVNLIGVANSIEAVLAGMIDRKRGHIVGLSSLASYHGLPRMYGYCASKAGLTAMLDGLRVELKPHGVRVTTVCPGWIRTRLTEKFAVPLPNMLEVDDAVRRILAAVAADRTFYAFPQATLNEVRLLRWLPTSWADWLVERRMRKFPLQ